MKVARRLLIALAATVAALLVAELVLRWQRPDIGQRGFADSTLGWSSAEYRAFDPLAEPRNPGKRRALFLGDSFLAGVNLQQMSERFPNYLATEFGDELEVRTLASAGWGPDQELLAFLEKGAAWEPDLVVLAFCANNDLINVLTDSHGGHSRKPFFVLDPAGELALHDATGARIPLPGEDLERETVAQSYLVDLARSVGIGFARDGTTGAAGVDPRYQLFRGIGIDTVLVEVMERRPQLSFAPQLGVNDISAYIHEDFELNSYQWRLSEAIFAELRDQVRAAGAQLTIMILPTPYSAHDPELLIGSGYERRFDTPEGPITYRSDEPRDRLRAICERLEVDLFDPTPAFHDRILAEDLLYRCWPIRDNRHFSRVGHYILAEMLAVHLQERGFLR